MKSAMNFGQGSKAGDTLRVVNELINGPPMPARYRSLTNSQALRVRAERVIPSGTQTLSKGPTQYVQGIAPTFLARAQGARTWDVDGNEYIDYPLALGPVILGHNYPTVTDAVAQQLKDGPIFSLPHPLEVEVAELLTELIPCAEMVRFGKNGSDVTAGAVRLARAHTGRDLIACCGYHGWQDWYIGSTSRNRGVPETVRRLTIPFQFNNLDSLSRIFSDHPGKVAAVIMEPLGSEIPTPDFLGEVRALTRREGALLIFDEIITGFRVALGGAQEYFGVVPDIACYGKAMANGFPLAAVVGSRDIMRLLDEVFFSFTFGGETLSLAAAAATLRELRERPVIAHLWTQGRMLQDGYEVLAETYGLAKYTKCLGLPPRTIVTFRDESGQESLLLRSLFQQEVLKRGILFAGYHNICYDLSAEDIVYTLRVYRTALEIVAEALASGDPKAHLEGDPVRPVFRAL